MQLPTAFRAVRVRRLLTVSAVAAFVIVAPAAGDDGTSGGPVAPAGHGASVQPAVVPVANTTEPDRAAERERRAQERRERFERVRADRERRAQERRDDRERRDRERRERREAARAAPVVAAVPTPATDPAAAAPTAAPTDPAAPRDTTTAAPVESAAPTATTAPAPGDGLNAVGPGGKDGKNNGLDVLGRDCTTSQLPKHNGFQESPACVETQMGEVAAEDKLPSLLITAAPDAVAVGQDFTLEVSTRNLVRDRFLGAAAGGYYLESSFLDGNGLQRGHFHTACRILSSTAEAPDSSQAPEFFVATQDNGGGSAPDKVSIQVKGIPTAGELQCTVWAGDGSHRTPMMTRANQTPAIDSVRINVGGAGADATAAPATPVAATDPAQVPAPGDAAAQPVENGATQDAGATAEPAAESSAAETAAAETTAAETKAPVAESENDAEARDADAAEAGAGESGDNN